jgi:hypothetical protein
MLEPRIVAARIHGRFALTQGAALPDDSTRLSSQGVFIEIRMPQPGGLVQFGFFEYSRLWIVENNRASVRN